MAGRRDGRTDWWRNGPLLPVSVKPECKEFMPKNSAAFSAETDNEKDANMLPGACLSSFAGLRLCFRLPEAYLRRAWSIASRRLKGASGGTESMLLRP